MRKGGRIVPVPLFFASLEHTAKGHEDEMSFSSPAYDIGADCRN